MAAYQEASIQEASIEEANGDEAFIANVLCDIARAEGMSQVTSDAGLSRESICDALSGNLNPTLELFALLA